MISVLPASVELSPLPSSGLPRADSTRDSNEQLALLLESARAGTWTLEMMTGSMTWSPETSRLFGDPTGTHTASIDAFLERVHPRHRDRVLTALSTAINGGILFDAQFELVGYDAVTRWVIVRGRMSGIPGRMTGVFLDVSERHQADADIRRLAGRLINAHEQERARLARELHDDMGQQVALLSAELEILRQRLAHVTPQVTEQTVKLSAQVDHMGATLHRLSHALHPARLEHLGLATAIRSLSTEVARGTSLTVHLNVTDLPFVEADVALCIYRTAQEALHNVVSHSGAASATVAVSTAGRDIVLSVDDDGVGFDADAVATRDTLGLVSMRERARLVEGALLVSSKPGRGTRVELRVPLGSGDTSVAGHDREPGGERLSLVHRSHPVGALVMPSARRGEVIPHLRRRIPQIQARRSRRR